MGRLSNEQNLTNIYPRLLNPGFSSGLISNMGFSRDRYENRGLCRKTLMCVFPFFVASGAAPSYDTKISHIEMNILLLKCIMLSVPPKTPKHGFKMFAGLLQMVIAM